MQMRKPVRRGKKPVSPIVGVAAVVAVLAVIVYFYFIRPDTGALGPVDPNMNAYGESVKQALKAGKPVPPLPPNQLAINSRRKWLKEHGMTEPNGPGTPVKPVVPGMPL